MPTIDTTGWSHEGAAKPLLLDCDNGKFRLPVFSRGFAAPNDAHVLVYPSGYLSPDFWAIWVRTCQRFASFDVKQKRWIWSVAALSRVSMTNDAAMASPAGNVQGALTKEERARLKADRAAAEEKFNEELAELYKEENVPENLWPKYQYPPHYSPPDGIPAPTDLQRIVVSRYWNQPYCIVGASVGTGKTRMTVDILSARATAPSLGLRDSSRIILVVAPLSLHFGWKRELAKWASPRAPFDCHIWGQPDFWQNAERSATRMFDGPDLQPGGQVIIVTPNALSRERFSAEMLEHGWLPTAIVVDEFHRMFRKKDNKAFKNLMALRLQAHMFIGLSGSLTNRLQDWWSLEEMMAGRDAHKVHFKGGTFMDYERLGDRETMTSSGVWSTGWTFERAIKEFHAHRIKTGRVFMASKEYYLKSLPGIGQQEVGEFSDLRLSFGQLFEDYPQEVEAAKALQRECAGNQKFEGSERLFAMTLLLRMRQLAATSAATMGLLKEWVEESLEADESGVVWVEFVNEPCKQLDITVDFLNRYGPTCYLKGGMDPAMRQEAIDGFQSGKYRFFVCQQEAGGVGLTLTKACKAFFATVPMSYLSTVQMIGRLHRLGQSREVVSTFALSHPVASFSRRLFDTRHELNQEIPASISGVLPVLDTEPQLH